MDFSLHKNPSLVENPSIVDDLALTKKSTIEGFQCTTYKNPQQIRVRATHPPLPTLQYALLPLGIHKEHSNLKQDIVSHVFFLWVSMFGFVHMAWENAEISVRQ